MAKVILVAYNGTAQADAAFDQALALARRDGARVHVLSVVFATDVETHATADRLIAASRVFLQPLRERAARCGVPVTLETVEGVPAWKIAARAQGLGADLIVIGHRRRSPWVRWMGASVAKRVIDRATCRVLVVS